MKYSSLIMPMCLLLFVGFCPSDLTAISINGVSWQVLYEADSVPDQAHPAWTAIGTQTAGTSHVTDGVLSISYVDGWEGWKIDAGPYWDHSDENPLTIEIRMRQTGTSRIEFGKWNRLWSIVFTDTAIQSRFGADPHTSGDFIPMDTTDWHIYRIVKTPGNPDVVKLYVDNQSVAEDLVIHPAGTFDFNLIRFMKMAETGTAEIDYIRYTHAVAEVPYWKVMYDARTMPDQAVPAWSRLGTQAMSYCQDNILYMPYMFASEGWIVNAGSFWNAEDAVTIEFRMKQHGLTRLEFGKSNRQWSLEFRDESITSRFGGDSIAVQTTQWRTYRIIAASEHALLYVDGDPVPAELHITPAGTTCCNWVGFRKMGGSIPTEIDYVYFAIDGSYPPNPPFCGPDDSGSMTGDLNYDCIVDLNDFVKFAESWLYHSGN